ncbi:MAG TPA: hypothetical protein ENG65_02085 [Candidatus Bathyarchaeota archaeon]|nr:hypothetical protein [Candidatus Bathyarchaeota archaeon]
MKRRSKLEIYLDILKAVSETSKLTHIGNMANLSWKDAVKHLNFLKRRGFVEAMKTKNGREEYRLTQKGFEALETLQKITNALTPKKTAIAV